MSLRNSVNSVPGSYPKHFRKKEYSTHNGLLEQGNAKDHDEHNAIGDGRKTTNREAIRSFLEEYGPAPIRIIAAKTGLKPSVVNERLYNHKGKTFLHLKEERAWAVCADNKQTESLIW